MNKYLNFCHEILSSELEVNKLKNVDLKVISSPLNLSLGYIKPNIKENRYMIVINLHNFKNMTEEDRKFYIYITILHELEHIKTFEFTKRKDFYEYEHFISLLEYISYMYELRQPPTDINSNLVKKILLSKKMISNYEVSTGEIKSSLESFKSGKKYLISTKSKKNIEQVDKIISSLDFLNKHMEITYVNKILNVDKMYYFLRNTSLYLQRYPHLINQYEILKIAFNNNGCLKEIEDLYLSRNSYNHEIIDRIVLSVININNIPDDDNIKKYVEELIKNYNSKIYEFYKNINLGKIFMDKEKYLEDNLEIIIKKSRRLNSILDYLKIEDENRKIL